MIRLDLEEINLIKKKSLARANLVLCNIYIVIKKKMENIKQRNILYMNKYLIEYNLEQAILKGQISDTENNKYISKNLLGAYLVSIRTLNTEKKTLVYNYIYYDKLFIFCLLYYFIFRDECISKVSREWGNYLVIADTNISKEKINPLIFNKESKLVNTLDNIHNYELSLDQLICIMYRLIYVADYDNMSKLINLMMNRDNTKCIKEIYSTKEYKIIEKEKNYYTEVPLLDSTLFFVTNLNQFINNIKNNGVDINQGPQKFRGQINSSSCFLSLLDLDFRNILYRHNNYHYHNNMTQSVTELSKKHFGFKNIHMNLGSIRWYSTSAVTKISNISNTNEIKNRQQLFQENYSKIKNILDKNFNVGSIKIQQEIEETLYNQENIFSDLNTIKNKLNFNDQSFEVINNKYNELIKLIKNPEEFDLGKGQINNENFLPWVKKIIIKLGSKEVVNLLLSFYMEILTKENHTKDDIDMPGIPTITAFHIFGKKIINKYIYFIYEKSNSKMEGKSLSVFKLENEKEFYDIFNIDNFYAKLGGFFVWYLVSTNLLYQDLDTNPNDNKKRENYLRINQNIRKIIMANGYKVLHIPAKLPMVCEPKDYIYNLNSKNNKLGGYILNDVYSTDYIFKDKIGYDKKTIIHNDNYIIKLINGLSKVPYKINIDTLNFIYTQGIEKEIIIEESKEIKKFILDPYKNYTKRISKKYRSTLSKIVTQRNILSIAQVYSKVEKIYFPLMLDQRTRIYCKTDYFDYQKCDLAKGLISFANPGLIYKHSTEIIKYFKAFGANMYGDNLDKKSLNYRVKWVDNNKDRILNFESNDIVNKAENKTCFVSFCFEYRRFIDFMNDKEENVLYTYLPIQLDASCNGYQHLSLLIKETKLFNKLNLEESTHDDEPNDFYTFILDKTNDYISNKINELNNLTDKADKDYLALEGFKRLQAVNFDRSIVKKTIMTKSYNATIPKQVYLIKSNLEEHWSGNSNYYIYKNTNIEIKSEDIVLFVMTLKNVIDIESPKIKELSKYLDNIIYICSKLSIPIPWVLPSGAEIQESYLVEKKQRIKAFYFVNSKYTFKFYLKDKYDYTKLKRATMPNLIHSLDGNTVATLYNKWNNIDLYTVHDCFAVTANNVPKLISLLKIVYINMYSEESYLINFDNFVQTTINNIFGDKVFTMGSNYVNITVKGITQKIPYPDVNKIINKYETINSLSKSSYIII